jgi:CubicO group peptidase (beta-lactamase class C family)
MSGFDKHRIDRLAEVMARRVEQDDVGGVAWLAARDDDVEIGTAGVLTRGLAEPIRRDTVFRIASMSKPIAAVAALLLVEECRLRLDDPVDELLPELAYRQVLLDPLGPIDGPTEPAVRPITVHDVLTFRLGYGMAFDWPWPQPFLDATMELGIATAPPQPHLAPDPDTWIQLLGTMPLLHQPGERWLYHYGSEVLGVLIARASGQPLERFLAERVFEPLGMRDTAFFASDPTRLTSCYTRNPETGAVECFDPPTGDWARMPAFPSGGGGLASTLEDFFSFGRMLLAGGRLPDGSRLLARTSVEAMTTDQIGAALGVPGPSIDGSLGWGFGVGVQVRRVGLVPTVGGYGWTGGLGSAWGNDPTERLVGIVLTTDAFTSAFPLPAAIQDFWTATYSAFGD